MRGWIGGCDFDPSAAFGFVRADMDLKSMPCNGRRSIIAHRGGQEMILNIRRLKAGTRSDKCARLKMVGRAEAGFEEEPTRADEELAEQVEFAVETDRLCAMELEIDLHMILQVLADTGEVMAHRNAETRKECGGPDAAALQNHR